MMGDSIDQWRCAIGKFHPCSQPHSCDETNRRTKRELQHERYENRANQNGRGSYKESEIQEQPKQTLNLSDQKGTNNRRNSVDNIERTAQELTNQYVIDSDKVATFKPKGTLHSIGSTVQKEKHHGLTFKDEKRPFNQNEILYGGTIQERGSAYCESEDSIRQDEPENNIYKGKVKALMNQQWVESLRRLPQLLVIIILLLIIGGVEANPGPRTDAKSDDSRTKTATHSENDFSEVLLSLFESISLDDSAKSPEPLEDIVNKHGLTIIDNDGTGDCLFQALSHQLAYTGTANIDHRDVRQNLVNYVKHHPQLPNGEHVTTQLDTTIIDDWTRYISSQGEVQNDEESKLAWYTESYMNKAGTWGDALIIWAFTQLFDVDVEIYSQGSKNFHTINASDNRDDRTTIRLGYIPHVHFMSLVSCKVEPISEGVQSKGLNSNLSKLDPVGSMKLRTEASSLNDAKVNVAAEIPKELEEMYVLGEKINACDQITQKREQAGYMCQLGSLYTALAQESNEGWDFIYATALYNAALQRIKQSDTDDSKEEVMPCFKHINAVYIMEQLQQIETNFLESVLKVNPESTLSCTIRYKKVLKELRTYSNDKINDIHVNDMQIDGITFDMSDENENRTIANSKIYYEKLTDKIVKFHQLVIGDCISVLGVPNVDKYAFIGHGSLARKEVTAWSDLESAIIYDPSGKTSSECDALKQQFRVLVHYFHMKVINLGETKINVLDIPVLTDFNKRLPENLKDHNFFDKVTPQGICFDGTLPKASKHPFGRMSTKVPHIKSERFELIQPIDEMTSCQHEEVSKREGYHLSDVLMTSTFLYGDTSLWEQYNEKVRKILASPSKTNPNISTGQERGLATLRDDLENYKRNPLSPMSLQKPLKAKHNIYRFATITINILKLLHNCESFNPLEILEELYFKNILSERAKKDLQLMVCLAVNMRHLVYTRYEQQEDLVSFIIPPSKQGTTGYPSKLVSVRDFTVIYRFYATFLPWSEFLEAHSNDMLTCGYAAKYINSSDTVKGELHCQMYFYENALKAFKREEARLELMGSKELVVVKVNLADLHLAQGHYDEAIKYLKESYELNGAQYVLNTTILNNLGVAYEEKGEHDNAIEFYRLCLTSNKQIYEDQPHPNTASSLANIGRVSLGKGQYDKAVQYMEKSLAMQKLIYKDQPHSDMATSLGIIGTAYLSKGQYDEAIEYLEESMTMTKLIYKDQPHPDIASALVNIGTAYLSIGQFENAIQYLEQGLAMQKLIYKDQPHPDIASSLDTIGSAYHKKGQNEKAIQYLEQGLAMRKLMHKDQPHPGIASSLGNIGSVYQSKGQYDEAIQYMKQSLILGKLIYKDEPHPLIATTLGNIGIVYLSKGQNDKAIQYLEQSLIIVKLIYRIKMNHIL